MDGYLFFFLETRVCDLHDNSHELVDFSCNGWHNGSPKRTVVRIRILAWRKIRAYRLQKSIMHFFFVCWNLAE